MRTYACRLLSVLSLAVLAACGGQARPVSAPHPSPSVTPTSVVVQLDALDRASFLISCDEVAVADAGLRHGGSAVSVARSLDGAAAAWAKIPDATVRGYAAGLRADRPGVVARALSLCAANGYKPTP